MPLVSKLATPSGVIGFPHVYIVKTLKEMLLWNSIGLCFDIWYETLSNWPLSNYSSGVKTVIRFPYKHMVKTLKIFYSESTRARAYIFGIHCIHTNKSPSLGERFGVNGPLDYFFFLKARKTSFVSFSIQFLMFNMWN